MAGVGLRYSPRDAGLWEAQSGKYLGKGIRCDVGSSVLGSLFLVLGFRVLC